MISAVTVFAQEAVTSEPSTAGFVIDLGTFTGIVALISAIVTQILKVIPAISESKFAKIGVSVAVGMVVCVLAWALQLTPLLEGYQCLRLTSHSARSTECCKTNCETGTDNAETISDNSHDSSFVVRMCAG